ncbi:TPA: response regulator [Candidatus Kaiserbacteria bacterium]|nr:response regulator [Candidatus Kaiserbacteria bacterium]
MRDMNDTPKGQDASSVHGSILLVDDDKFLLDMYGMKFTGAGFTVQTCLSAEEALDALRKGFVADVILFDLVMPEHDGFSFLETRHTENLVPGAILIALTNQSNDAEKKRAEEFGVEHFIVKASMIPSEVVEVVKKGIAKSNDRNPKA